jgi:inosine-uridine nucleoside N-ribohydrolase
MWQSAACLLLATASWGASRDIVVFDTDSCLFCDDGAALVMLLRSPSQVAVHGITLVPGNVWPNQGAEYMFHILDLLKRPVPIYGGAHGPLVHNAAMAKEAATRWGKHEYIGAFGDNPAEVKPAPGFKLTGRKPKHDAAVEFLVSEIERYPGEVTILALGPLTNIALALKM